MIVTPGRLSVLRKGVCRNLSALQNRSLDVEWSRWVSPSSPNAKLVWQSFLPTVMAKCVWYAWSSGDVRTNFRSLVWGLTVRQIPGVWWKARLGRFFDFWSLSRFSTTKAGMRGKGCGAMVSLAGNAREQQCRCTTRRTGLLLGLKDHGCGGLGSNPNPAVAPFQMHVLRLEMGAPENMSVGPFFTYLPSPVPRGEAGGTTRWHTDSLGRGVWHTSARRSAGQ